MATDVTDVQERQWSVGSLKSTADKNHKNRKIASKLSYSRASFLFNDGRKYDDEEFMRKLKDGMQRFYEAVYI